MKSLFLGSYGYGNLGDELCLIEAMQAFPSSEVWAFSNDPDFTAQCVPGITGFIRTRAEIAELKPERVVLGGGGVGFFPSIRDSIHWMYDAFAMGAACHIHNIGVANMADLEWAKAHEVQTVLNGLKSFTVRDHISWFATRLWPGEPNPGITFYPEQHLPADTALTRTMQTDDRLLGISITGQAQMIEALRGNQDRVRSMLAHYRDHKIVPIVSTYSRTDQEEDDVSGFNHFRDLFLRDFDIVCPQFLDKHWWRREMSPLRLKGIIGALDTIITQRKHNLIHAIGTDVPAVGIFPSEDDSIARIFYSLRDRLPLGSMELSLNR